MGEARFNVAEARRWFAVECNNLAWALVEQPARTDEETERMLHAAHAAMHHWGEVGTPVNQVRGLCLVATAYVAAGRAEEALREARRCAGMAAGMPSGEDQHGDAGLTSFDRACAQGCLAAALRLGGKPEEASAESAAAVEWVSRCDAEERALIERLYGEG